MVPQNILMWKRALSGHAHLILLISNDFDTQTACNLAGISTVCIEHTVDGFPRFDLMMRKMETIRKNIGPGIVVFLNTDIEFGRGIESDLMTVINGLLWLGKNQVELLVADKFSSPFKHIGMSSYWFAAMNRWDVKNDGKRSTAYVHNAGGFDLWAWNIDAYGPSLLPFDIPPFRYPLASYDNWLLDMVNKAETRTVVDITGVTKAYHMNHDRKNYHDLSFDGDSGYYLNKYLALKNPDPMAKKHCLGCGTLVEAPYIVEKTGFNASTNVPVFNLKKRQKLSYIKNKNQVDEQVWTYTRKAENHLISISRYLSHSGRHRLKNLVGQRTNEDGYILLTAVTHNYRQFLLNLICNLERLGSSYDHLVIAALDYDVFQWGATRGLPIFFSPNLALEERALNESSYDYNSREFRAVTKQKSQATLKILQHNYSCSVVYMDVDITWFLDPFVALRQYMTSKSGLTIQSNAPLIIPHFPGQYFHPHASVSRVQSELESNGYRRLNSGLYVAPNSRIMRMAFTDITRAAVEGQYSEQQYFYYVLCSRAPSTTIGNNQCEYHHKSGNLRNHVLVNTLDRYQYPTGAVVVVTSAPNETSNIYDAGINQFENFSKHKVIAAHNNWIFGQKAKVGRLTKNGWWFLDDELCKYSGDESILGPLAM
eukprot:CAMPEP_0176487940 /NCGR_PEP_ID=MMETSP0200_2-20121128/6426_1 /TAXON_ID=947934 /ORGANISM="Chaetoceros sp., Strain GSL56" /LENGTH=652 /DNA_ID=CAMNT_0017884855 /DNA_START=2246 /DNA_END=4204 /DNA_ORIENTATION=+